MSFVALAIYLVRYILLTRGCYPWGHDAAISMTRAAKNTFCQVSKSDGGTLR